MNAPGLVFAVGGVLGDSDPASLTWKRAIASLGREVQILSQDVESPVRLNVVFCVAGRLWSPEFQGVRARRMSARYNLLIVNVGIVKELVPDYREHLLALLAAAVSEADRVVSRKFPGGLAEIRAIVARLSITEPGLAQPEPSRLSK